jgi:hypothetical protein
MKHIKKQIFVFFPNIMNFDLEPKLSKLSFEEINGISIDSYYLEHSCSTGFGSFGCPIFNVNNYKIISIHLGKFKDRTYKKGNALENQIDKFNNNYNNFVDKNDNNDNYDNYDNNNYQNENIKIKNNYINRRSINKE